MRLSLGYAFSPMAILVWASYIKLFYVIISIYKGNSYKILKLYLLLTYYYIVIYKALIIHNHSV